MIIDVHVQALSELKIPPHLLSHPTSRASSSSKSSAEPACFEVASLGTSTLVRVGASGKTMMAPQRSARYSSKSSVAHA